MNRVGIIGHFGIGLNLANGQTIKTKVITEYVSKAVDNDVIIIDTHGGVKAVIPAIMGCIKCVIKCKNIIILLTENGLRITVPVLCLFNRIFNRELNYIVIGGWLAGFIDRHRILAEQLKRFDNIYVETSTMQNALKDRGFSNSIVLKNCKVLDITDFSLLPTFHKEPFHICTFSRVMREKGIETLINVVKRINKKYSRTVYLLDIYGQIDNNQKEWFNEIRKTLPSSIRYRGIVPYDKSVEVLRSHFLLVFPTHFYTEGVPGTIIDAYSAGVPVIAAKWENFTEVVEEGMTGLGYDFDSVEALEQLLEKVAINPDIVNTMRQNCLKKAKEYMPENALRELIIRIR